MKTAPLANIQLLRAFASTAVVLLHTSQFMRTGLGDGLGLPFDSSARVELLFVVSGFILTWITLDRAARPVDFFAARVARIVPLYWLLTLFVFAIAVVAPSLVKSTSASPADLIRSLLFIPYEKQAGVIQPILFVGWSLNYEMLFYALFTVCLFLPLRARLPVAVATLALFAALGQLIEGGVIWSFFTRPIILCFGFGMVAAKILKQLPPLRSTQAKVAVWTATIALLLVMMREWSFMDRAYTARIPAGFVVLLAAWLDVSGAGLRWRPLVWLGDISYSTYLVHPFVLGVSIVAVKRLGLADYAGGPMLAVLLVAAVLVASAVTHYAVDRPLAGAASRWLRGSDRGRANQRPDQAGTRPSPA